MNRLSQTFKVCLALLFAVLSSNLLPVYASALTAPTSAVDKIDICHANEGVKGYTLNDVDVSSISNLTTGNGHGTDKGTHSGDIIPPFTNTVGENYEGKNWTAEGMTIYANDCETETTADPEIPAVPTVNTITKCDTYGSVVLPVDTDTITYSVSPASPTEGKFTVTANPAKDVELDVTGTSYTLGQNGKATFEGDLGEYSRCPVISTLVECESFQLIEATNQNLNGWTLGENASFVDGGMKLDVTGNWDTTSITRTLSGELKDLGTGVDFAPNVDYLGLHVKTSAGTLTYEKFYENQDPANNTGKWWSEDNFNVAGGQGYATFDTLENIVAANPGVTLENVRVLYTHPDVSTATVTSVKIGCKEYVFDYVRNVQACTVQDVTYRGSWMFDGYTYPEADDYSGKTNSATYEFTNEGLHLSTPDVPSYVFGLIDGGNTALADVNAMSYKTFRKAISAGVPETQPAYVVLVDTNGSAAGGEEYFIYEPYNNSANANVEDTWQTWDAYDGGNAKWWSTATPGQVLHTWDYYVANYPEAVVLAYGFNQGTSNAETYAIIQDMMFDCATTTFAAPKVLGDTTTAPVVPVTPAVVASAAVVLPAEIPATGSNNQFGLLLAIVLGSITYFVVLRRKESYQV